MAAGLRLWLLGGFRAEAGGRRCLSGDGTGGRPARWLSCSPFR